VARAAVPATGTIASILNVHSGVRRDAVLGESCSSWGVVKIADFFVGVLFLVVGIGFFEDLFGRGGWHL
jgi:hypothetical protein